MPEISSSERATLASLATTFVPAAAAIEVNPMISIMALARRVSRTVLAEGRSA